MSNCICRKICKHIDVQVDDVEGKSENYNIYIYIYMLVIVNSFN